MSSSSTVPNPIISRTQLRAYPGWEVVQHADGSVYGNERNGCATTWGVRTFAHAVRYISGGERGDIREVPGFLTEVAA